KFVAYLDRGVVAVEHHDATAAGAFVGPSDRSERPFVGTCADQRLEAWVVEPEGGDGVDADDNPGGGDVRQLVGKIEGGAAFAPPDFDDVGGPQLFDEFGVADKVGGELLTEAALVDVQGAAAAPRVGSVFF